VVSLDKLPSDIKTRILKDVMELYLEDKENPPPFQVTNIKEYLVRNKMTLDPPGMETSALYNFQLQEMAFDIKYFNNDFLQTLQDVAHESTHRNQHTRWLNGDLKYKISYTNEKPLPPKLEKYRNSRETRVFFLKELQNFDVYRILKFWEGVFGYDSSPHEQEASLTRGEVGRILDFAYKKAKEYTQQKSAV